MEVDGGSWLGHAEGRHRGAGQVQDSSRPLLVELRPLLIFHALKVNSHPSVFPGAEPDLCSTAPQYLSGVELHCG